MASRHYSFHGGDSDDKDDPDIGYGYLQLVADISKYAKDYRPQLMAAFLLRVTSEAAALYPAYALGKMTTFFTAYKAGEPLDYFIWLSVLWLIFSLYRTGSGRLAVYKGFKSAEYMAQDARMKAMRHLFSLDLRWHESDFAGSKMQRILNGAEGMRNLMRLFFNDLVAAGISIIGASIILFTQSWQLSVGLLLFSFTYYLLSFILVRKSSQQLRIVQKQREAAGGVNFESISNIALIKVMDLSRPVLERIEGVNMKLRDETVKLIRYFRVREGVTTTYAVILKFLILIYISWGIYHGRLEVGVFVMFYVYFDTVLNATAGMSRVTDQVLEEKIAMSRFRQLMETKPTVEVAGKKPLNPDWHSIEVKGVSFSYTDKSTLRNISFTVRRGQKVGVVGPTGSGKSTIFKLMLKLDEGYTGDILVDGDPLRDIDRHSYIERIAVVPQETEVFNATLRDNIEITSACKQDIIQAVEMANLSELVARLPEGIDTLIGEKGVKLSGGEKQRLSIARAFYKCPDILFLDEPTSQLDANSELRIQDSLRKVFKDVTAIVIAHRLSTIQEMDKIIVLMEGEIVEEGTFHELLEKNGLFHELWMKQKL
jgi:ABC-type multidrug transport system fused ATPase/permease subunit